MTYFRSTSVMATCAFYERLKMLPLLRQVRECGCDARLKLRYGFSVITPANLAFASGKDKCLFGSEAPVLRRFPHALSEFLVRKQQTPLNSGFCHIFPSLWTVEESRN